VWVAHISRELLAMYRVGQVETEIWEKVPNIELHNLNCLYLRGGTTPETQCCGHNLYLSLPFYFLAPGMKEDISNYGRWRGWEVELQGLAWKMEVRVPSPGFNGKYTRCCRKAGSRWIHSEVCIADVLKLLKYKIGSSLCSYSTTRSHSKRPWIVKCLFVCFRPL
jgi:hypothetical protein